jgi:hypothetical protein
MIIFKNFFSFALTWKAFDWLVANSTHARPIFNALGSIQLVICLSSIPLCKCPPPCISIHSRAGLIVTHQTSLARGCGASHTATTCSRCLACVNASLQFCLGGPKEFTRTYTGSAMVYIPAQRWLC